MTTLGIMVNTDRNFPHLLGLARAAARRGLAVQVFLTHRGVRLAGLPEFGRLQEWAQVKLCRVSLTNQPGMPAPDELPPEVLGSQADHHRLIAACDRYLVL